MTECPKCGKLFGVIDDQRAHVPLCNATPETQKQAEGKCRSCGKPTDERALWTTNFVDGKKVPVYDFVCYYCQNDVGGA